MNRLLILSAFLVAAICTSASPTPAKKYLDISVLSNGTVYMWPDTLNAIEVAAVVQERLWKSYLGTGNMYDAIRINYDSYASDQQKNAVIKAVQEGQSKALTDVCLQKFKKRFDELSPRQQKKLRNQFPVLFQALT